MKMACIRSRCIVAALLMVPAPAGAVAASTGLLDQLAVVPATTAQIDERCHSARVHANAMRIALENKTGRATVERDFRLYDDLVDLATSVADEAYLIGAAHPRADLRSAGQTCSDRMNAVLNEIGLSRKIYARLAGIRQARLPPETRHILGRVMLRYKLAGVDRDAATRNYLSELAAKIAATGSEFERNIAEDQRQVVIEGAAALDGLPKDFVDAHRPAAGERVAIAVTAPNIATVLTYAQVDDTRRKMYAAALNLGYPVNEAALARLISQRHELARLLGHDTFAAFDLADKMAGTPSRVDGMLQEVSAAARPAAQAYVAELVSQARQSDPTTAELAPWSVSHLADKVRKHKYAADGAEVRQYFALDTATQGIFRLMKALFGATIRPWRTPVWAPDVTAWSLYDGNRLIGQFYLDLSPRAGKFNLARAFLLRRGVAGKQVPIGGLLCNFPAAGPMEHSQFVTYLHEFGHLMHFLYGGRQRFSVASAFYVERDFLEAPSQLLEEWAWDYDTLKTLAKRPDGVPISRELVARMGAARRFGNGIEWARHAGFSSVALGFYNRTPGFDLKSTYDALQMRYTVVPDGAGTHRYANFFHLNVYGASDYSYVWSKAIAYELLEPFKAHSLNHAPTSMAFRREVLEAGSSKPADAMISAFVGRPWTTAGFRNDLAQPTDR